MQYKVLALAALAAGVSAQTTVAPEVQASVLNVLLTALPPSALEVAATNSPAFIADVYSSLSEGNTPGWYQSLPGDVKTLLAQAYPAETAASTTVSTESESATATTETTQTTQTTETTALVSGTGGLPNRNSTSVTSINSPTLSPTGDESIPTGAASRPTAVLAAGFAGAVGFLGMLAL